MDYYSLFWGPPVISTINEPRGCIYMSVINTHSFGQFWPVSWTTQIWGPEVIFMINEPRGAFTCRSLTLAVFVDSERSHRLLLIILWLKAVSMVVEPQGVLTCWSSRLAVLADSGPFLGLLLSFGVPK